MSAQKLINFEQTRTFPAFSGVELVLFPGACCAICVESERAWHALHVATEHQSEPLVALFATLNSDLATDELLETGDLADESWARCEAELGRDACIDLVAAVSTWSLISKLARGLRVPLEEGISSWPPDGLASPAE